MATQHQTVGVYRNQWTNVGAGHQTAQATTVVAHQQPATPPYYQPQQRYTNPPQQHQTSHHQTANYNANTYDNRVPTATSPSKSNASSTGSQSGSQNGTTNSMNNMANTNSSNSSSNGSEQLSKTNLYIRGLNPSTTDKDLVTMCQTFGTIISTKAILDKTTNKCKGYGFVDFDSPAAAEGAVKALTAKNIQAQMAKVGNHYPHRRPPTQQEQDPTNLYIANLPPHFKESDLDNLLSSYGPVISTRILRDSNGSSKGVGFARMENKEKCEKIIQFYNGNTIQGCKEPLLVKFADGGNKKKLYKNNENAKLWRETNEGLTTVGYEHAIATNGVAGQHMLPALSNYNRSYGQVNFASYPGPPPWGVPAGYVLPASMPQVDETYNIPGAHLGGPYKNDGQGPRSVPIMLSSPDSVPYNMNMLSSLTAQMSAMHLGTYQYPYYPTSMIQAVPVTDTEHTPNAASPEDPYQAYHGGQPK